MPEEARQDIIDAELVEDTPAVALEVSEKHRKFVAELRAFADFYEARPELAVPRKTTFNLWPATDQLPSVARLFGHADKKVLDDSLFYFTREFGEFIKLDANWHREQVCERVVVGHETVEERVPVTYETRTYERDKVEWHCPKVLKPRLEGGDGA